MKTLNLTRTEKKAKAAIKGTQTGDELLGLARELVLEGRYETMWETLDAAELRYATAGDRWGVNEIRALRSELEARIG